MWVRGLKLVCGVSADTSLTVAPHVGAWIETLRGSPQEEIIDVAPHVGAWIETEGNS